MNAFLIFCKRQRGCVRRKYPFLENREVTRVLGEWWASLRTADKSMYSALANQQKENLRTHSELKWFKPKMPGGKGKKVPDISPITIVPGKLADESQLGKLSSLLNGDKEPVMKEEVKAPVPKPLKKRYRDEIYVLDEFKPTPIDEKKVEEEIKKETVVATSENNDEDERLKMWRTHILEENNNVKEKHDRACKGQRYREFMWTNYSTRKRTNRWELNQDKIDVCPPIKKHKTVKSEISSSKPPPTISNSSSSDEKADASPPLVDSVFLSGKKKKGTKANSESNYRTSNKNSALISNNTPRNSKTLEIADCDDSAPKSDSEISSAYNSSNEKGNDEDKKSDILVVGSRKRKIRKQEIRRLAPGSTFKGVDVISEN